MSILFLAIKFCFRLVCHSYVRSLFRNRKQQKRVKTLGYAHELLHFYSIIYCFSIRYQDTASEFADFGYRIINHNTVSEIIFPSTFWRIRTQKSIRIQSLINFSVRARPSKGVERAPKYWNCVDTKTTFFALKSQPKLQKFFIRKWERKITSCLDGRTDVYTITQQPEQLESSGWF
jgi:hypothetical protein